MDHDRIAHFYDACVRTDLDVPFFLAEAKKTGGRVLTLMAGAGRVSIPLLEAGIDLTCVDSSAAMLDILRGKLREKSLAADAIQADVCQSSLRRRFDSILVQFDRNSSRFMIWGLQRAQAT
ncbi:MAG: hypothetical protein A2Y76_14675 [Planctomycetes bacterium RBG_13_60_9]|nr:MAG: hypothetical protein A2Y76_14675 [Planctomycetes bacterium RBG_13_60_9]